MKVLALFLALTLIAQVCLANTIWEYVSTDGVQTIQGQATFTGDDFLVGTYDLLSIDTVEYYVFANQQPITWLTSPAGSPPSFDTSPSGTIAYKRYQGSAGNSSGRSL